MDHLLKALPPVPSSDNVDPLQLEMCWADVRGGLHRILLGHVALVLLPIIGVACLVLAVTRGGDAMKFLANDPGKKLNYETELLFIAGILAIAAGGLISYPLILSGQWRCVMNAPERCNAKWLMFICMVTVVAGPAMAIGAGILGTGRNSQEVQKAMAEAVAEANPLKSPTLLYDLASTALSLSSVVCFGLFLRSIAVCFNNTTLARAVDLFLIVLGILVAVGLFALLGVGISMTVRGLMLLIFGLGMIASFVWYLLLLVWASICIANGIAVVHSPRQTESSPARWS